MKDIEFRGKRKDNGERVYGHYCVVEDESYIIPDTATTFHVTSLSGQHVIEGFVRIDPDTVGQYIGRNDKNGRKIFEGDKLRYTVRRGSDHDDYETTCDVLYDKERCGFLPFVLNDECEDDWYSFAVLNPEVIGNVWDNPELLEQSCDT